MKTNLQYKLDRQTKKRNNKAHKQLRLIRKNRNTFFIEKVNNHD